MKVLKQTGVILKSKNMKCNQIHKKLIFYIGNELPVQQMAAIKNHLDACDECRGFLEFLRSELQVIDEEKNPEITPFFYTRLSARLDDKSKELATNSWLRIAQPAFFTVLLIAGIYTGISIGSNATSNPANPQMSSIVYLNDFKAEPIESFLLDEL